MVQCEMQQRRKQPSIDLYAGIFNSKAFRLQQHSKPRHDNNCPTRIQDNSTPSSYIRSYGGGDPAQLDLDQENGDSLCLSGLDGDCDRDVAGLGSCHNNSEKTHRPSNASGSFNFINVCTKQKINQQIDADSDLFGHEVMHQLTDGKLPSMNSHLRMPKNHVLDSRQDGSLNSHGHGNDSLTYRVHTERHDCSHPLVPTEAPRRSIGANKGDPAIESESASMLCPMSSASSAREHPGDSAACHNGPESTSDESSDGLYSISSKWSGVDVDLESIKCSSKHKLQTCIDNGNVGLGEPHRRDYLAPMMGSHNLSSDFSMKARLSGEQEVSGRGDMTGWSWNDGQQRASRAGSSDSASSCGGSSSGGSPMVSKPTKDGRLFLSGSISVGKGSPHSMSSRSMGSTPGSEVFCTGHLTKRRNVVNAANNNDKFSLLSSSSLLVGGVNGNVLSYGAGAKMGVKQEIPGSKLASVDCGLLRKGQASSDPECIKNAGNEYYKRGHFSEALILYDRAVSLRPGVTAYRGNRAAALSGLGRLAEAVKEYQEAIRLDPSYALARRRASSLCMRLGLFEDAKKHLCEMANQVDIVEAQCLRNIEKHYARCIEARHSGDWQNVIRESDAAVVAGADSAPQIFGFKGEALLMLQKWEDADTVCLAARKIESSLVNMGICPANSFLDLITTELYLALGRFEEAVRAAESAVRLDPTNGKATKLLTKARAVARARATGNDVFKVGRFFEALALYTEGLESDSTNAVLLCNRAACRLKLGQWEKAVEDCNAALKVQPNYTKALTRRASSLMKLERWEDAMLDYEVLRKALPEDREVARAFFDVQVAMKKSRGEVVYGMKFGVEVEEITNDEQFREAVKTPGLSVVQFVTRWSQRCRELSPVIDELCRRHPCVNFLKVDAEDHPRLVEMERVSFIPTFKIYKNGQKMKEIIGPTEQSLEYLVQHYSY